MGVVATSPHSVEQAQLLGQRSDRVIYFANVVGEPDEDEAARGPQRRLRPRAGQTLPPAIQAGLR